MTESADILFPDRAEPPTIAGYALIALERSIDKAEGGLTYAVPEAMADLAVGERVGVPLGRGDKVAWGVVVDRMQLSPEGIKKIKPIARRPEKLSGPSEHPLLGLPEDLVQLARWIASYYHCPLGMVFSTMRPAAVKQSTGLRQRLQIRLAEPPPFDAVKPTKLQQKILDALDHGQHWVDAKSTLAKAGGKTISPVKQLIEKGWLEQRQTAVVVSDLDLKAQKTIGSTPPLTLTDAQQQAVDTLTTSLTQGFTAHLLHGVTGSGKTEVYLRVIEALIELGSHNSAIRVNNKGVIVLVPEIALTPQTVGRFLSRFMNAQSDPGNSPVAVLHSGLTAAQRNAQWQRIRAGKANIVVGARSAIFAPMPSVGLIIVDEEHETSYKQDQLPRYHARDVAIRRAQLAGCPVVLGSATPSLESAWNAGVGVGVGVEVGDLETWGFGDLESGGQLATGNCPKSNTVSTSDSDQPPAASRQLPTADSQPPPPQVPKSPNPKPPKYVYHHLPDRVPGATLPQVELIDLAAERRERQGVHLLSSRLETLIEQNLASGGQTILLLNRRGYANYIACPDHRCGWMMTCDHCDVTMVYHRDARLPTKGVVRCHHCTAEQLLPPLCPESNHRISVFGLGTQRVEEELRRKFPQASLARMDADAMRKAADYQQTLDAFADGRTDILLGTQMIAKGLDVPNVRLVGVVSGDTALNFPDFRAAERTFQLIAQVAGRAGRGEHLGRVVVQTFNIDDPTIKLAAKHDYLGFAKREIEVRGEVGLPPIGRMARIVCRDTDHPANEKRIHQLAATLRQTMQREHLKVRLKGPAPCPIARVADHHRSQIELLADRPGPIQKLLTALRNQHGLTSDTHTAIDVDPVALL